MDLQYKHIMRLQVLFEKMQLINNQLLRRHTLTLERENLKFANEWPALLTLNRCSNAIVDND
jgi:hypothetical protein